MRDFSMLFKAAEAEKRKEGEVLFSAGEAGATMYVVRSGAVGIEVAGIVMERVGPGEIVGEMALIDDSPRSASAVALTDCEVVPVDQKRFLFLVQQTPYFALDVMRIMARRLRAMNQRA
jgi:CRP/FNR family cyclic AMP-dependent transcriptional regulator